MATWTLRPMYRYCLRFGFFVRFDGSCFLSDKPGDNRRVGGSFLGILLATLVCFADAALLQGSGCGGALSCPKAGWGSPNTRLYSKLRPIPESYASANTDVAPRFPKDCRTQTLSSSSDFLLGVGLVALENHRKARGERQAWASFYPSGHGEIHALSVITRDLLISGFACKLSRSPRHATKPRYQSTSFVDLRRRS